MPPRKSTKTLPAPADTRPNAAPKQSTSSAVLSALREEEESDSTTTISNSNSDEDEIANAADESNPAGDEDDDSDSIEEVPIAIPQKRGKASKNTPTSMSKFLFTHICISILYNELNLL